MIMDWLSKPKDPIEAKCKSCGQEFADSGDLTRGSLDAHADLSVDYDLFCPECESDDVELFEVP